MSEATAVPRTVGVVGGGRMGSGIAHAFLLAGARVVLVERDDESADGARSNVLGSLARSAGKDPTVNERELGGQLSVGTDLGLLRDADLVIEAVPEDVELKQDTLRRVSATVRPDAVIGTNTSSVPIGALAEAVKRPERFLGLHFFNPVPASALVEIVHGAETAPEVVDRAAGWVAALGKRAVIVADAPGFASSRLGVALGLEAMRMVEEGVASPADIDAAMELGYRHPTGPLRTTDIVGLDVRLGIAEELQRRLGNRFEPPEILRRMVDEGKTGRKSGHGFYDWSES
nr:3-hydroxyacyl-CoA dehydrogenase family protein [Microbacterium gorillae]